MRISRASRCLPRSPAGERASRGTRSSVRALSTSCRARGHVAVTNRRAEDDPALPFGLRAQARSQRAVERHPALCDRGFFRFLFRKSRRADPSCSSIVPSSPAFAPATLRRIERCSKARRLDARDGSTPPCPFMYASGLRVSELCALKQSDVICGRRRLRPRQRWKAAALRRRVALNGSSVARRFSVERSLSFSAFCFFEARSDDAPGFWKS